MQQYVDGYMMKYQKRCCKCICVIFEGVFSQSIYMWRRGLVAKWILWYQWKVTAVVSQRLHIYVFVHVVHAALWNTHSAVFSTADMLCRVCVYLCVIMCQWCRTLAITSWQRGPSKQGERVGGGGAPGWSLRGSGGQMCRIHQTHSPRVTGETHTLWMRDGWAADATPRSTVHPIPPFTQWYLPLERLCVCVCVFGFLKQKEKKKTYMYLIWSFCIFGNVMTKLVILVS